MLQGELEDVLSKESFAVRRMTDVDGVMEALRRRVAELQSRLETEMATAAQLPDALDQVRCIAERGSSVALVLLRVPSPFLRRSQRPLTVVSSYVRRSPSVKAAWARLSSRRRRSI